MTTPRVVAPVSMPLSFEAFKLELKSGKPGDYMWRTSPPRVHPNGFIQVDVDAVFRLHVFHPRNPYRQQTYHPVHNHVFGFESRIYSGRLINVTYSSIPTPPQRATHIPHQAFGLGNEESELRPVPEAEHCLLYPQAISVVQPGESYTFPPFAFHETLTNEPTLTLIKKWDKTAHQGNSKRPTVLVPVGVVPDNKFRRDSADPEVLWQLIQEAWP